MAKSKEISKVLASLERSWKQVEAKDMTQISNIPDGQYVASIEEMEVGLSKNGRLQVVTTFKIQDGKQKGKTHKKFDGLDSDEGMAWVKGYFDILGIDVPETPQDIPAAIEEFVSNVSDFVNITLKTKDGFQNTYVKGYVEGAELDSSDEDEDNTATDDDDDEIVASDDDEDTDAEASSDDDEEEDEKPARKGKPAFKKKAKAGRR